MDAAREGQILWEPGMAASPPRMEHYRAWLARDHGVEASDYHALWQWSVESPGAFWSSLVDYFEIAPRGSADPSSVSRDMLAPRWFPELDLNYCEVALRRRDASVAIRYVDEDGATRSLSYEELADAVGRAAQGLRELGVGRGDRVAAYLPNVPEAVVGFLATSSLGAIWSLCSPRGLLEPTRWLRCSRLVDLILL